MLFKKGSRGDGSLLQNQFTSYLVTAVRRRKNEIIKSQIRRNGREMYVDIQEYLYDLKAPEVPMEDLISDEPTSFQDMYFENEKLERALRKLTERDRYVLFARAMAERSFEDLAAELGLSYKGIAAVYARAIKKLKKELEDADK
ncbi:MAG: sigma-70 family RNA polymerase sigma factor [Bacteroidaceae bacterium]|nr:sigma-70 family RNA polymerase sigma factor [Bacteroidaceae bacterium]